MSLHGYPFPDLEYYYFYPLLQKVGLLLVDDIQIPSIGRMFEILKRCGMFALSEVVKKNLAIFKRTQAPVIDPQSDSWWLQGYNKAYYEDMVRPRVLQGILGRVRHATPSSVKRLIPQSLKTALRRRT
jgi:hypothetical protein